MNLTPPPSEQPTVSFGDMTMDLLHQNVMINGSKVLLTPKEMALLYILLLQAETVVNRESLQDAIGAVSDRALESQIYRLRKKLEGGNFTVVTLRGKGYRLERTDCV